MTRAQTTDYIPPPMGVTAVKFTKSAVPTPGVKVTYNIEDSRVLFHVWPDPTFPANIREALTAMVRGLAEVVVDYVPEVKSWFVEATTPTGMAWQPYLVNKLLERLQKVLHAPEEKA